jgi:hypothetical protein
MLVHIFLYWFMLVRAENMLAYAVLCWFLFFLHQSCWSMLASVDSYFKGLNHDNYAGS